MAEPSPNHPGAREQAVHERRNWVRLTFACNNRCAFCLDSATHDGGLRPHDELVAQIVQGREAGASRLILSGGEPTIHPSFIELVRLGVELGYRRVQTVTNGRRFAYPAFLKSALEAGLGEITFSVHGPDAATHDALVGVQGAYEQTIAGLRRALADGRAVVNVDVVLSRRAIERLDETLERLIDLGVEEFELLWPVPFGRAFTEGRELLLDADCAPALARALDLACARGATVWLSRVPPEVLDGHDELLADPHKLFDEVRGRLPELLRLVRDGIDLDCRDPERCARCALRHWCASLDELWRILETRDFDVIRIEAGSSPRPPEPFGLDPASERRAAAPPVDRLRRAPLRPVELGELLGRSASGSLWLVASDLATARRALEGLPQTLRLELELRDAAGLAATLAESPSSDELDGRSLTRVLLASAPDAAALLALPARFGVVLTLSRESAAWLETERAPLPRLSLRQPCHELASTAAAEDVDLAEFFARFVHPLDVEGVPPCLTAHPAPRARKVVDLAVFGADGRIDPYRFTERFVRERARARAGGCRGCRYEAECEGLPIQHRRAGVTRPFPPLGWRMP